ncbi:PREDICTED: uncharacterized protein LOC106816759 [Priapulus caudatus]|uniref:Uncharacterized protein LOC106816759 n=1 Tax=Priapulus caudatus TaxID=37621 RepID=A0ABM1EXE7_PRICU|nr:PREDICTED: uncharacterized protein LOC106816759 [Priapulus caudatus]
MTVTGEVVESRTSVAAIVGESEVTDQMPEVDNVTVQDVPEGNRFHPGAYTIVRCGAKLYIGMILAVDTEDHRYNVKYMKQTGSYFEWLEQSSWQNEEDLVVELQVPVLDRRGHTLFTNADMALIKTYIH